MEGADYSLPSQHLAQKAGVESTGPVSTCGHATSGASVAG